MANSKEELKLIRMNEAEATAINWLWYPYPIRKNHGHTGRSGRWKNNGSLGNRRRRYDGRGTPRKRVRRRANDGHIPDRRRWFERHGEAPKASILTECGRMLLRYRYRIRVLNTINFKKSMRYSPFSYIKEEKDILKLVSCLIANTKGEKKGGDEIGRKAKYCSTQRSSLICITSRRKMSATSPLSLR